MPRLQAAAAGVLMTFCNPERMRAEWLYEPAGGATGAGSQEAVGLVMLRSLAGLVPPSGSPCVVVREEALTAVGIVAQVCVCARARVLVCWFLVALTRAERSTSRKKKDVSL